MSKINSKKNKLTKMTSMDPSLYSSNPHLFNNKSTKSLQKKNSKFFINHQKKNKFITKPKNEIYKGFKRGLTKVQKEKEEVQEMMRSVMRKAELRLKKKKEKIKKFRNSISKLLHSKYRVMMNNAPHYDHDLVTFYTEKTQESPLIENLENYSKKMSPKLRSSMYVTGDWRIQIKRPLDRAEVDYPKIAKRGVKRRRSDADNLFLSSVSLLHLRNKASRTCSLGNFKMI